MKRKLNRKIYIYIGCFAVLAFVFSKITNYIIYNDTPLFILQAYKELKGTDEVIRMVGEVENYEYSYNINDTKKDTIPFRITVLGRRAKMHYECNAIKSPTDSIFKILYHKLWSFEQAILGLIDVLNQIQQASKNRNMQMFEVWYGKLDTWLQGLNEKFYSREEFLKQIKVNKQDKKMAKFRAHSITSKSPI